MVETKSGVMIWFGDVGLAQVIAFGASCLFFNIYPI